MTAFTSGIRSVVAGAPVQARMTMTLPVAMDLTGAYARWELLDSQAHVWAAGDCAEVLAENSQINAAEKLVSADANIVVPANVPANDLGSTYQIRYTLIVGTQQMYAFEQFQVQPATFISLGAQDAVELFGDQIRIALNLPRIYDSVYYEVYQGNSRIVDPRAATAPLATADGQTYGGVIEIAEIPSASLDPYSVIWSYWDGTDSKQRENANVWIVNPVLLDAVREVESYINRAYVDSGIAPGTTFDAADIIGYLRIGRDQFNAADKPTNISMLNAIGPFRQFWIGYSVVAACRAQQLAEGMKAFNFSGQNTQLEVDRTQHWEQMATAIDQQLQEQIKPFKDNLYKRGIIDGDGSNLALRRGAVGIVGVTLHGASPMRGGFGLGTYNNGFPYLR